MDHDKTLHDTYVKTEKLNASFMMKEVGLEPTYDPDIFDNIDESTLKNVSWSTLPFTEKAKLFNKWSLV